MPGNDAAEGGVYRFWDSLAAHWFEDLPDGERLGNAARWFLASCGVATFVLAVVLVQAEAVLTSDPDVLLGIFLIGFCFTAGLGFLLAWKRPRTGPVRLFVSGVTLPSFVLLAARIATGVGG